MKLGPSSRSRVRRAIGVAACTLGLVVGGLVPTASPAQAVPLHDSVVLGWYEDFLARSGWTDPGRRYWVDQLDAGVPERFVLGSIIRSEEYATRVVGLYYQQYLGRDLDRGAEYWVQSTAHRDMAFEWVAQNVLASPEAQGRYQAGRTLGNQQFSPEGYAGYLINSVLMRTATPGERSWWGQRVRSVGALGAVRDLWYTDEALRIRLSQHYRVILDRGADLDGAAYWAPLARASDITLQVELAVTAEYVQNCVRTYGSW